MTEKRLGGRLAVITGAGRGIGEAIALEFAAEGASLATGARTRDDLDRVAQACRALGASCSIHVVDVSVREQVEHFVSSVDTVDILVNCAGVYGPIGPLAENDLDLWEAGLRTNLMGTLYTCREVIPRMVYQGPAS